jgi:hypothetical protein
VKQAETHTLPLETELVVGIVSNDPAFQERFALEFKNLGAFAVLIPSADSLTQVSRQIQFNGFIVDFRSTLGTSSAGKMKLDQLEAIFPYMRVIARGSSLSGIVGDRGYTGDEVFSGFFNDYVKPFIARGVQIHPRKSAFLRASWTAVGAPVERLHRAVSFNISDSGAFLIECGEPPVVGQKIQLDFELKASEVRLSTRAIVRWQLAWDQDRAHPPGFGVEFEGLDEVSRSILFSAHA